ncbi:hypothetical protein D3C78_1028440 [compost metagenome]
MVGDFLRTQHQALLVAREVAEYLGAARLGEDDRAARGEVQLAGVEQFEGGVLQHLGIHAEVLERRVDQAGHHRVGDGADADLQGRQVARKAPALHLVREEADQVVGDGLGIRIRRQHLGRRVAVLADDDGGDARRIDRDRRAADALVHAHQRNRRALRAVRRQVDVVQAFQVAAVAQADLDDHPLGELRQVGRVAHRGARHDVAVLGDGHRLDHRDIRALQLVAAHLLDGFRQVLVDEHHLAGVDRLAQRRVGLERHAPRQQAGFGHVLVETVAEAGAGDQADAQGLTAGALDQREGHGLGIAGAGEAAHADGHAVLDQRSGFGRTHDLVVKGSQTDALGMHG